MGVYIYGVSGKNRKVKGLDEPVYELRYVSKPSFGWEVDTYTARMCGVYNRKPSARDSLVAYELYNEDVEVFRVYRYKNVDNTFYDSAEDRVLEAAGFVKRVGKRLEVATEEEFRVAEAAARERDRQYEITGSPWDNALVFPAGN